MIVMRILKVPGQVRVVVASEQAAETLELHGVAERLDREPDPRREPLRPARPARA